MLSHLTIKSLIILMLICHHGYCQKKWAGPVAGDWEDASNWVPQGVPGISDDIILDNNTQKSNYKITFNSTVSIHSLSIEPSDGNNIELILLPDNKGSPALIINGTGNSFNIKKGGVFRNASGLASGQSIQLNGLLSLFNEGRYIHSSRSSHATEIVARLSTATGTEKGIFEFDVPGGSYPISFSNRIYGTLILSSDASGGTQTYNASGSNQAIINGDFQISNGVQFNLDLTKDMIIKGDYIQGGGIFNIASQPNNNVIKIMGNVQQSLAGSIAETSAGLPLLELCGEINQQVSFAGSTLNEVTLKINNPKGITLTSPLKLAYKLQLTEGTIKTSQTNLLTLLDNCTISGGSAKSFIDGPIKKIGDDDFEFPVGKQGDYAPVTITGSGGAVTDEFRAEYFLGNPELIYGTTFESPPVVRISKLEFWVIERLTGSSVKKVSLYVGNYSNATALDKLVLVRWDAGKLTWENKGNSFFSGIATGIVRSNDVANFGAFTLGSTVISQNPLPLEEFKPKAGGLPGNINQRSVKILHSPVSSQLILQVQALKKETIVIVVTDMNGKKIRKEKYLVMVGINSIPLQVPELHTGVYFVSLYDNNGMYSCMKFVNRR